MQYRYIYEYIFLKKLGINNIDGIIIKKCCKAELFNFRSGYTFFLISALQHLI